MPLTGVMGIESWSCHGCTRATNSKCRRRSRSDLCERAIGGTGEYRRAFLKPAGWWWSCLRTDNLRRQPPGGHSASPSIGRQVPCRTAAEPGRPQCPGRRQGRQPPASGREPRDSGYQRDPCVPGPIPLCLAGERSGAATGCRRRGRRLDRQPLGRGTVPNITATGVKRPSGACCCRPPHRTGAQGGAWDTPHQALDELPRRHFTRGRARSPESRPGGTAG